MFGNERRRLGMTKAAISAIKHFSILLLGAVLGFGLLSWFLNHSQCQGLTWNGELGMPFMTPADEDDCMRTGSMLKYEGIWEVGYELNNFYPLDTTGKKIAISGKPLTLDINDVSRFLIHEKLNIDPHIPEPHKFRITFYGNLMTNYYEGDSTYKNHYDVRKIESISAFDGNLPSE